MQLDSIVKEIISRLKPFLENFRTTKKNKVVVTCLGLLFAALAGAIAIQFLVSGMTQ